MKDKLTTINETEVEAVDGVVLESNISDEIINDESLLCLRQAPIIEENLESIKAKVTSRVSEVLEMECNEETYKSVKKARADLRKEYEALERRRKDLKASVMARYKEVEGVYKTYAGDVYAEAFNVLDRRIEDVENGLLTQRKSELKDYFNQYRESLAIPTDFIDFARANIKVTLSASKKKLGEEVRTFLDRVAADLRLIATQQYQDEVLLEYKNSLNCSDAILRVQTRKQQIEAQRQQREAEKEQRLARAKAEENVLRAAAQAKEEEQKRIEAEQERQRLLAESMPVAAPTARPIETAPMQEELPCIAFKVTGTIDQLKAVVKFLNSGGYKYEQLDIE